MPSATMKRFLFLSMRKLSSLCLRTRPISVVAQKRIADSLMGSGAFYLAVPIGVNRLPQLFLLTLCFAEAKARHKNRSVDGVLVHPSLGHRMIEIRECADPIVGLRRERGTSASRSMRIGEELELLVGVSRLPAKLTGELLHAVGDLAHAEARVARHCP